MSFQTRVNQQPAPGAVGSKASMNPTAAALPPFGGYFTAGGGGVYVGSFVWPADYTGTALNNYGNGPPIGFVPNVQQGLIEVYLQEFSLQIPAGFPVVAMNMGDYFVQNNGSATSAIGNKAYANNGTGAVSFAASGSPTGAATVTGANQTIVANTFAGTTAGNSCTASISGTTMTVTAIASGTCLFPGQYLSGGSASVGWVDPATAIVKQLAGATTGGTGTYQVSVSQTVGSTTIAATGGTLTVTGRTGGALITGQLVTGTGLASGTTVVGYGSGTATGTSGTIALSLAPTTAEPGGITVTGAGAYLVATSGVTGTATVNDPVIDTSTATNMPAGTYVSSIFSQGSGALTAMLSAAGATSASTDNLTINANVETGWYVSSVGAPGEFVVISRGSWVGSP